MPRHIGTLAEKSLHAALKAFYALPGDSLECDLDGSVIDILRPSLDAPPRCIEIQTRSLSKMKPKLHKLLDSYAVHVVYPIPRERFIVRVDANGEIISRRKSPKRGTVYDLFPELVAFPALVMHPNLTLEAVLIREEQVWLDDGRGSWRRKRWSIADRRLLGIVEAVMLQTPVAFAALLPPDLPPLFDSADLARAIKQPRFVAQKMAYCLREMGVIELAGKRVNTHLYRRNT